jgi:hypothetical protein
MRKITTGSLLLITGIIFFLQSCTPGTCFEETKSSVKISFYSSTTRKALPPDSITVSGLERDSLIYFRAAKVQPALLQLNAATTSSSFILMINGVTDTIKITYSSYPHFISKECGYTFYQHLDTITPVGNFHIIKSIDYINRTITNLNIENIQIYY